MKKKSSTYSLSSAHHSSYFFGKYALNVLLGFLCFWQNTWNGLKYIFEVLITIIFNSYKGVYNSILAGLNVIGIKPKSKKEFSLANDKGKTIEKRFAIKVPKSKVSKSLMESRNQLLMELKKEVRRSSEPIVYRVVSKYPDGKIRRDTYNGHSKQEVYSYLTGEGHEVYKIETSESINFVFGSKNPLPLFSNKMKKRDLVFWLTQLSTYVKSGISLTEAMRILAKQMGKKGVPNKQLSLVVKELTAGNTFSVALEKQGDVFPQLLINMLKAAEATGELEETLDDMASYYDEIEKTRKQMISAMIYPSLIFVFAIGIVTFIMLYVIPQFEQIFESSGAELNALTKFILNMSYFMKDYSLLLLLILVLAIIAFAIAYKRIKAFRKAIQMILMKIPVVSKIIIYNEMTIFSKTFASLLKNNVFITDSIDILIKITNNEVYKQLMIDTIANIAKGEKISKSFENHWAVPDVAYYMIVTGESTGELASMMSKVSDYYQEMHKNIINSLKSLIEPFMIVFLALIVGVVVIAVVIPMLQMYDTVDL